MGGPPLSVCSSTRVRERVWDESLRVSQSVLDWGRHETILVREELRKTYCAPLSVVYKYMFNILSMASPGLLNRATGERADSPQLCKKLIFFINSSLPSMLLLPCSLAALLLVLAPLCSGLNLDVETPTLFSGPNGSYFGFSVEFYLPGSSRSVSRF